MCTRLLSALFRAGVVFAGLASAAQAQTTTDNEPVTTRTLCTQAQDCLFTHWTFSAGLGRASTDYDNQNVQAEAAGLGFEVYDIDVDTQRLAWKANLGVSLSPDWTLEAGFTDLGEVTTAFTATTADPQGFYDLTQKVHPSSVQGATLSAVYQVWGNEDGYLQARIGGYFWKSDYRSQKVFDEQTIDRPDDESGVDLYYGLGYHLAVSKRWQLGLDWERYRYADTHSSVVMLNLAYRLGRQ